MGERSNNITLADVRVTPKAVQDKLNKLNPNKAQGPDQVPPRVLKEVSKQLATPLSILFNKSLESGSIPEDWKSAGVTVILKREQNLTQETIDQSA